MVATSVIRPQPGPQEQFLASSADIVIYGGAAGGGKTWAMLIEPLRHIHNSQFRAVIFRRTTKQVRKPGGLLDESSNLYPLVGAKSADIKWTFQSGAEVEFAHMEHLKNRFDWQGSLVALFEFDELTHFEYLQFFYILSRSRSTSGVKPYIRASTNADPDSWVATFISWWIDQDTGLAIQDRSGVIRWFIRDGDNIIWGDSPQELVKKFPHVLESEILSVTFISASVYDNKILLEKDPSYLAKLKALPKVEREQLLGGNWKIRPAAGLFFKRSYFKIVDAAPLCPVSVRYWDRAATEKTDQNDPDWTAGLKMGKSAEGQFYIFDVQRLRESPLKIKNAILNTASSDGKDTHIRLEQEPGASGKSEVQQLVRDLAGYKVSTEKVSTDKITRASPFSAQCEAGNVFLVRGAWNEAFIHELESFPGYKDDQVDAGSGAFNFLVGQRKITLL